MKLVAFERYPDIVLPLDANGAGDIELQIEELQHDHLFPGRLDCARFDYSESGDVKFHIVPEFYLGKSFPCPAGNPGKGML